MTKQNIFSHNRFLQLGVCLPGR